MQGAQLDSLLRAYTAATGDYTEKIYFWTKITQEFRRASTVGQKVSARPPAFGPCHNQAFSHRVPKSL